MDYRSLPRHDLALLCAAVGPWRRLFVSMILRALVDSRGLNLFIEREGRTYTIVCVETAGDAVVTEHRLPIAWAEVDEVVRLCVLMVYVEGLLAGGERWHRRVDLQVALTTRAQPAND